MMFPKISLRVLALSGTLILITIQQAQSACTFNKCKQQSNKCMRTGKWKFCSPASMESVCGTEDECTKLKATFCQEVLSLDCDSLTAAKAKGCRQISKNFNCEQTTPTDDTTGTDDTTTVECTSDCPFEEEKLQSITLDATSSVDDKDFYIAIDRMTVKEYEYLTKFGSTDMKWEYEESLNSYILKKKMTSVLLDRPELDAVNTEPITKVLDFSIYKDLVEQGSYVDHLDLRASAEFFEKILIDIKNGEDIPVNIYGADDRYVYRDTSYPWSTVGRVGTTSGGSCTGTMVGRNLMLTASHCMQWNGDGTVGAFSFVPAYYNGDAPFGTAWATKVYYWNKAEGGLSDLESGYDYVVAVLNSNMGDLTGYAGYRVYSNSWNGGNYWQNLGYPGGLTGAERPTFTGGGSIDTTQSQSLGGGVPDSVVLGNRIDMEPGHSGGPYWGWWDGEVFPRIVGVCSAESRNPTPTGTLGDNEAGGGQALWDLISYARAQQA